MLFLFLLVLPSIIIATDENVQRRTIPQDANFNKTESPKDMMETFDASKGRLPSSLSPLHYDIRLQPFIHGNRSVHGSIAIEFVVKKDTNVVILNINDIITLNRTSKVTCVDGNPKITKQTYDPYNQFYTATLDKYLSKGSICSFSMQFRAYLNNKLVGFYCASFNDSLGKQHHLGMTQFSPTDARRAFPSFDEPGFKATFNISLLRRENMTALSNMPIISSEPVSGQRGWIEDKFDKTLKMSTYLIGFLVSDFTYRQTDALLPTQFRVWTRPEAIDQANFSLSIGPKLLTSLENYFGIKYPLPKLDMAAVPSFKFNGMENWGLIMYRESAMLVDPLLTTVNAKLRLIQVIAHEIAHMWFGNLVTPMWWSELWLKEGFANFMGYKAADEVLPEWNFEDGMAVTSTSLALQLDSLKSSHPINVEVGHPDRISEIFDTISYNKGASIIRMMYHFLTESVYRPGMTNYLKTLQFDNAVQDDLWHFLTASWNTSESFDPDRTVKTVMDTWTLQDGYPILNIEKKDSDINIQQERFLLQGNLLNDSEQSENRSWWIPISYTDQTMLNFEDTQPKIWMTPENTNLIIENITSSPDDWYVLNVKKTGFYRVNYDVDNWSKLMEQLMTNHSSIHPLNRAQLIDDTFNFARAGIVNYSLPLKLVKYMTMEQNLIPWLTFSENVNYILRMTERHRNFGTIKKFLANLVQPLYDITGFSPSETDVPEIQRLRILATKLACLVDHSPCVTTAKNLFDLWTSLPKERRSEILDINVMPTVLCNGIKSTSEREWNKTFDVYLNSNSQSEKNDLLIALGCSKDARILRRYLEMALNPSSGIQKQDGFFVFQAVSVSDTGRQLAWNTVRDKWLYIFDYFGSGSNALGRILGAASEGLNTENYLKELKEFGELNKGKLGAARRTFDEAVETVTINAAWMTQIYNKLPKDTFA